MAVKKDVITRASTGQSPDYFLLGLGDHVLYFEWAGTPGVATPKARKPGTTTWFTIEDQDGDVSIIANRAIVIVGGQEVSVSVDTATSSLAMTFARAASYRTILDGK